MSSRRPGAKDQAFARQKRMLDLAGVGPGHRVLDVAAVELIQEGKSGVIPIRRNGDVEVVPLTEVIKETRRVPKELYDLTKVFE